MLDIVFLEYNPHCSYTLLHKHGVYVIIPNYLYSVYLSVSYIMNDVVFHFKQ